MPTFDEPGDLIAANLATVQGPLQPTPTSIASTTTIAPTTFLSIVSGTITIATITPPITGTHMLCMIFTNATPPALVTTGNIFAATTLIVQNRPTFFVYQSISGKYYTVL